MLVSHRMVGMRCLNMGSFLFFLFLGILISGGVVCADGLSEREKNFRTTGLSLPRFVSLAKDKTNVRAGPGEKYPIKWVIHRKNLPVEVILEFDHWRKIKDHEGQEGWVFHSLLSGERTAVIRAEGMVPIYEKKFEDNDKKSRISMMLEPFVIVKIKSCRGVWCKVSVSGFSGWVQRKFLWGVYEPENID